MLEYTHNCVIDAKGFYKTFVRIDFILNEVSVSVEHVYHYVLKDGEVLVETDTPTIKTHIGAQGLVHPRWVGAQWIEGATPEEIAAWEAEHPARPPSPPTPTEILQEENCLLRAQITAESNRTDFIEDCIAEMAAQVYT